MISAHDTRPAPPDCADDAGGGVPAPSGKSHGVPLYVHELCHWLRHSKSASGYALPEELEHKVPPTLHGFIQAQVDRLPPGPAVVLRCASVLGVEFGEVLLGALLPQGVAATLAELHDQLLLLQDLHLVQQRSATPYAASLSDPSGPGLQWQVSACMPATPQP